MSWVASAMTVGLSQRPPPWVSISPPVRTRPPHATASAIWPARISACRSKMIGPISPAVMSGQLSRAAFAF
jgi:hypothetical protein